MNASAELQIAVIARLLSAAPVVAFLGSRIWDNAPAAPAYPYMTLGPAQEVDDSAECIDGVECYQQIDIWTQEGAAQLTAKRICGAVRQALHGAPLLLGGGCTLILVEVEGAEVTADPDGQTTHGIVNLRALIDG